MKAEVIEKTENAITVRFSAESSQEALLLSLAGPSVQGRMGMSANCWPGVPSTVTLPSVTLETMS